jgi:dolichol-phosphate mannosyltransferase
MTESNKMLVLIPTYNEAENVDIIIGGIRDLGLDLDLLFVDDNSPDGTGQLLDEAAAQDPRIHVLHRPGKMGIGSAHLDGIRWAYDHEYTILIPMDCDQTHRPEDIPRFIELMPQGDIVVGSRFTRPASLVGWNLLRKSMTHFGHWLTVNLLGLPYDATGAFRLYRLDRIPRGIFEMVETSSYSYFFESLHRLFVNQIPIVEFPIDLPARTYGHSKMRFRDMVQGLTFLLGLAARTKLSRHQLIYVEPPAAPADADDRADADDADDAARTEWDAYWSGGGHSGKWLYDLIAAFYRRFIIRPSVNRFLGRYFVLGKSVLHAGCGSGAVDVDMAKTLRITGLDISPTGLAEFMRFHPGCGEPLLGSIFNIPAEDESYDGVFNLGVMEHFTEEDIGRILREFNRVLRTGSCAILFWPPAYGLSVNVLKAVHFVLNRVLGRDIQLHPVELTHVTSLRRTMSWLAPAGFDLVESSFGIRDAFTYEIIVARKIGPPTDHSASGAIDEAARPQ